jgi:hypothetical protein
MLGLSAIVPALLLSTAGSRRRVKMNKGPFQQRAQSRAVSIGHPVLAAILTLSFLAVLLPLGASADNSGLRACCIGKAGHETGSCSTGLIQSDGQTQVLEVSPPKAKSKSFANVKGGAGAGEHCSLHASTGDDPDAMEASKPEPVAASNEAAELFAPSNTSEESQPVTSTNGFDSLSIHSVSNTCPNECGACSVSYTRRPRPREQSTQSSIVTPRLPSLILVFTGDHQQARLMNWKWSQLQPRAPPVLLV